MKLPVAPPRMPPRETIRQGASLGSRQAKTPTKAAARIIERPKKILRKGAGAESKREKAAPGL